MSLRPRTSTPNPARGGDGRRLRWSESPVPRPGVRRVRAQGAAPQVDVWTYFTGGGQLNYGLTNYPSNTIENFGGSDGETYVSLLTSVGVPPLLPSGWTSLASGSVGSIGGGLHYAAGYIQWGAATPQEQIATIDGSTSAPTNQGRMVWNIWGVTGHYTPVASVTTRAAGTSHPLQIPSSGWGSAWNMNAYLVPYPLGTSSATGDTINLVNYGEGAGYPFLCDDMGDAQFYGTPACTALNATRTSVNEWDSASFAFGWIA